MLIFRQFSLNFAKKCQGPGMGSDCGSVGRAVGYDTRDPRFKSSHWQTFIEYFVYCIEMTEIKEKRPGMALFKKNDRTRGKSEVILFVVMFS